MSPQVSSAVGSEPGTRFPPVPHTTMSRFDASATSITALCGPVVTNRRRLGSRLRSDAGNGVRSRMATTTGNGAGRSATSPSSDRWSWKYSTSTPSGRRCQGPASAATR